MARSGKNRPSVLNWLGTLILFCIPGVNLIFLILSIIFAKSSAKRNFAIAGILLMVLCALALFAAFIFFPDYLAKLASSFREMSANHALIAGA